MSSRYPPRADLEFDEPTDGFPDETCAICGTSPCAMRVRWWETQSKQISAVRFERAGRTESHYFCIAHREAAERVYVRFTSMKQRKSPK